MTLHATALLAMLGSSLCSTAASGHDSPPQYKLSVGQEIQYQVETQCGPTSDSTAGETVRVDTTRTLWVVCRNDNGSSRILERDAIKESHTAKGSEGTTFEREELSTFDVFPDGKVVPDDAKGIAHDSLCVFPRLPRHAGNTGWRANYPDDGWTEFTAIPGQSTERDFVFRFEEHTLQNAIYLATNAGTVHFDPERGLLVAETSQSSMDYGFHVKIDASHKLKSVELRDSVFIKQLADESQTYFKACDDYGKAEHEADRNLPKGDAIMKQAGEALRDARSKLTPPMFTKPLDEMLSRHDHIVRYFHEEAQHVAGLIDKPAPESRLSDLSGHPHSLADYRGKVVVLDFWYRGCGWCMKAMPQMEQVAEDFKPDSVVVLGMNTDRNVNDARFVADKMRLNYTTLLTGGLPERYEKYDVRTFPTFIIIDAHGKVRAVLSGYSPHLREELDDAIRKLLPK